MNTLVSAGVAGAPADRFQHCGRKRPRRFLREIVAHARDDAMAAAREARGLRVAIGRGHYAG